MKILTSKLFKFPLNSIKESEKINEALSINFFISSSRTDKTDKKKIKLSGFAFLDYLFDHRYFVYNNYVSSWQRSSFFPASVFLRSFNTKIYNQSFSFFKKFLKFNKIWPILKDQIHNHHDLGKKIDIYQKKKINIAPTEGKVSNSSTSIESSYNEFFNSYNQTKRTLTDNLTNAYVPINYYDASSSKNLLLGFRPYRLLNKNIYNPLLVSLYFHNEQKTPLYFYTNKNMEIKEKENYPPYFTTSDTLLKILTWRFLKKIKQTHFSKNWSSLLQEQRSPFKIDLLPKNLSISALNYLKQGYSETEISLFENKTNNSFFVKNNIHGNNLKNLTIGEKTDNINNEKISMIQNKNNIKWVQTPVIINGVPHMKLKAYKNMYEKYLSVINNSKTIHTKNSFSYSNNLWTLQNQCDSIYPKLNKESYVYLYPFNKQAWKTDFISPLIRSKIPIKNKLIKSEAPSVLTGNELKELDDSIWATVRRSFSTHTEDEDKPLISLPIFNSLDSKDFSSRFVFISPFNLLKGEKKHESALTLDVIALYFIEGLD